MKKTLNLPKTAFSMKANLTQKEPELVKQWQKDDIYSRIRESRKDKPSFVLHDGPPYANGNIHHGHVLNKLLKDFVVKSKTMTGHNTAYLPGWDCHGLPIEHKVELEMLAKGKAVDTIPIRRASRAYADKFVKIQKKEFSRLGILGEWDEPYKTMNYHYQATIARQFARFVEQGYVYKGLKPVHWDFKSRTALAEAEVEYHDHSSPSVFVTFPLKNDPAELHESLAGKKVEAIIWTTTPWTLPANMAIAFHPNFDYLAYEKDGTVYIFAEGLAEQVKEKCDLDGGEVLAKLKGGDFEGKAARHPWLDRDSVFVVADYVTLEAGTGCVHTAPGHGADDYFTGMKYGIPIYSPVDDDGCFIDDVEQWAGLNVFDANPKIVEFMKEHGCLLSYEEFEHQYPFGWRSKSPVIFRSTEQWFVKIDHENLRERALEWIKKTDWFPAWGEDRITLMIANRPDWCISRQRSWGVPIIAFYRKDTGEAILEHKLVEHMADLIEEHGADIWFEWPVEKLLPEGYNEHGGPDNLDKESDILDVWFDSGCSHAATLGDRDDLPWPSDLYLEGSDQHRGWFHSSLLCGIVGKGGAPYRQVLTHGFVVDGKGKALSKSLGNYTPLEEVLKQYGAEILRLWVAQTDYRDDIRVSDNILKGCGETYKKIRNTARFMLGVLNEFNPDTDCVSDDQFNELDRYALQLFERLSARLIKAYHNYEFHTVYHSINHFMTVEASAFFLDIYKDRLYCDGKNDQRRRSAQTVVFRILNGLVRLLAPMISFTAEEIWKYMPDWEGKEHSVHLANMLPENKSFDSELQDRWTSLRDVRDVVLKALEEARGEKVIGNGLDARVVLSAPDKTYELLGKYEDDLAQMFIVSQVELVTADELHAKVVQADGEKCERCWNKSTFVGSHDRFKTVCQRCATVLEALPEELLAD